MCLFTLIFVCVHVFSAAFIFLIAEDLLKVYNEQNRINKYLEQKRLDEFNRKYREKMQQKRQSAYREHLARKLFESLPDVTISEEKCYQAAVKDYAKKWDEQEKKQNEHIEKLRKERLTYHSKEMDTIKELKEKLQHEYEMDKAKRKFNEKIDLAFYRQQYADRVQKAKQLRRFIGQQIELDKKSRHDEVITSRIETNRAIESEAQKDDQHFFVYAQKLIKSAKSKGIPLHPLKKVIDEYTVQNALLPQCDDLPHMKSQIDIGISVERKYLNKQNK